MTKAMFNIYQRYIEKRGTNKKSQKLLIQYGKGEFKNKNIGINTVGDVPEEVATFLGLEDPELYSGNCFS